MILLSSQQAEDIESILYGRESNNERSHLIKQPCQWCFEEMIHFYDPEYNAKVNTKDVANFIHSG
jgi:hypothetical protein